MKPRKLVFKCVEVRKRKQDWNKKCDFVYEGIFQIEYKAPYEKVDDPSFTSDAPFGEMKFGYYIKDEFEPGKLYSVYIVDEKEEKSES